MTGAADCARIHHFENSQELAMAKQKSEQTKVANAFHLYVRLLGYVRRYWVALVVAMLGSMAFSGVDAWLVFSFKPLLNKGIIAKNHEFVETAPFILMAAFIFRGIASFFSNYYIASASRSVIMSIRQDLFGHLQRLPARYYDHNSTGQVLSTLLYAVDQVANASADVLTSAIQAMFLMTALLVGMIKTSWKLTLLYFAILPLVVFVMRFTSVRIRRLSLEVQNSIGNISHNAEENIEGYKVVRAFEGQEHEAYKFNKATRINRQREMKVVVTRSVSVSIVQFIMAGAIALTLYIALMDTGASLLTPGGFVAMLIAMFALLKPMKDLAFVQNKLYRGLAGAQKVFELMDEKPEVDTGTKALERASGAIEFSQVNFKYNDEHNKHVLDDISFKINPGEIVALVGRSGSGKSTIVSLLPRFYNDYTGDITLDNVSVRDYHLKDLRRQFALVSQNVTLFQDTVRNNIAYGRFADVTDAEIREAAKAAHALEFIEKLPKGFDSQIGENGVLLSGGQRQRIAIARAVLKNAPILILDEATSSLDTESERYIQAALDELMKTRTTLVIAHRLSTVEHANKIIVMDDGKIIETGNHQELLAQNGHYARLYRMQFKDVSPMMEVANAD